MREKTYLDLLKDQDVKHWYENLRRGSKVHADLSLKRLRAFCTWSKLEPSKIITAANRDIEKLQHLVEDYVSYLEGQKKAPAYIGNLVKPIRSWLEYKHGPKLAKIKITNYGTNPTTDDERVPSQEELARIFRFLGPRERTGAALIGFAGCRIEVLGNYDGVDGLKVGDFPEMAIKDRKVSFQKVPTMVRIRPSLSKAGHKYFTFLGQEGCDYLTEYLESRLAKSERLTAESSIIAPHKSYKKNFLYATKVADHIRDGIRKAGFPWRPYVLRSYADTAFEIAESKGLIIHAWRQFFMGHKGDIEARYSTNKGRLPPEMIEQMRESYGRCLPLLETHAKGASSDEIRKAFKEQLLLVAGFKKEEVERMDLDAVTDEELQQTIRQRLLGMMANNGSKQKVIPITEVENHLTQGWEYVASLPNDRAILRLPF